MAVLLETSRGDIVIDLFVDDCPVTCKNFLKLCKAKYYNNCLFHNVQSNFIVQTGDPTGTGKGGTSVYGLMYGEQARFFDDELRPKFKHKVKGMVGMASPQPNANASQFYITTGEDLHSLDGKHTVFGQVGEGLDVLSSINEAFVDDDGRPLQNIRIRHTIILDDPFEDPPQLAEVIPPESPPPQFEQGDRLEDDWVPAEDNRDAEQIEEETRKAEAHNRAVVLEMIGDLPEADAKPPSNVLFICKLNPVTTEEDLDIIFSRFGNVVDCSIIRDYKTGDSLCYGFIGFDNDASCEEAYFKMNNVLIDDRRIKVDFSQSVAHLWKQFKKGGRKGDASMAAQADSHVQDPAGARNRSAAGSGRLEYKGQTPGGSRPAARQHGLLLDDEPLQEAHQHEARAVQGHHNGAGRRPHHDRSSHRGRDGSERSHQREGRDGRSGRDEVRDRRDGDRRSNGYDREQERERERDRGDERDRHRGRDSIQDRGRTHDSYDRRGRNDSPERRPRDDRERERDRHQDRDTGGGYQKDDRRDDRQHRDYPRRKDRGRDLERERERDSRRGAQG